MKFFTTRQLHFVLALTITGGLALMSAVNADSGISIPTQQEAANVNENTVGVVFTHEELFHQLVHNMEDELESSNSLRIVPIMGKNHVQSIYDLLYLKGVDLALVRADAIEYVRTEGGVPDVQQSIKNVAKVSDEKIVIIANKEIDSIDELEGQIVSRGLDGSGEYVTGTIAFKTLGIQPDFVEMNNTDAIQRLRSGELAAMVYLLRAADAIQTGADLIAANAVKTLRLENKLHLLEIPRNDVLSTIYNPATLTIEDLPELIATGVSIPTFSVDAIIAAYNWRDTNPRYQRSTRFINAFVGGLDGLKSAIYQPVWKRVDLGIDVPNVDRLPLVENVVQDRVASQTRLAELKRIAKEQEEAEARAAKIAELVRKRDEISERLGQVLNEADSADLEQMLSRLNKILGE